MAYAIALLPQAAEARSFIVYNISDASKTYFIVNGTSGNVGIGTTGPGKLLHVKSASDNQMLLDANSGGQYTSLYLANNGTQKSQLVWDDTGNRLLLTTINASAKLGLAGGNIGLPQVTIDSSGNVGIGTTGPTNKLEVAGNVVLIGSSRKVLLGNGQGIVDDGGANLQLLTGATDITFFPNGNEAMRIKNGGNVGIGTTAPMDLLHINSTGDSGLRINGVTRARINLGSVTGGWQIEAPGLVGNSPNGTLTITESGAGPRLTIQNGTGNVGIGTTNPGAKLHVQTTASGNFTGLILDKNAGNNVGDETRLSFDQGGVELTRIASYYQGIVSSQAVYGLKFYYNNGSTVAAGPAVTIDGTGNVGIGTASPGALLDVSSPTLDAARIQISERNTNGGENGGLIFRGYYSGTTTFFDAVGIKRYNTDDSNNANNNQRLGFFVRNPVVDGTLVERMSIDRNGNVGIGTTSPSGRLHVTSDVGGSGFTTGLILDIDGMVARRVYVGAADSCGAGYRCLRVQN